VVQGVHGEVVGDRVDGPDGKVLVGRVGADVLCGDVAAPSVAGAQRGAAGLVEVRLHGLVGARVDARVRDGCEGLGLCPYLVDRVVPEPVLMTALEVLR
jgi:hypothetical protein